MRERAKLLVLQVPRLPCDREWDIAPRLFTSEGRSHTQRDRVYEEEDAWAALIMVNRHYIHVQVI
jgi:hypothetical protein